MLVNCSFKRANAKNAYILDLGQNIQDFSQDFIFSNHFEVRFSNYVFQFFFQFPRQFFFLFRVFCFRILDPAHVIVILKNLLFIKNLQFYMYTFADCAVTFANGSELNKK